MPDRQNPNRYSRRGFFQLLTGTAKQPPAAPAKKSAPVPRLHFTHDRPLITLVKPFFQQAYRPAAGVPQIDVATWTLGVSGLVEEPLQVTYAELRAMPPRGETRALMCIGNAAGGDQIGNAVWRGVRLADVLARARVRPEATHLRFDSADGYFTCITLAQALDPDTLLAYDMNGSPLTPTHGYPLRALLPGRYGLKSPKWLIGLTLTDSAEAGTWEGEKGWSSTAEVKTWSRIDTPKPYAEVRAGQPVALQGVAYAGTRRITAVEVSIDGGGWMPVTLRLAVTPHAWTQWYTAWTPLASGEVTIQARATDESGFTQHRPPAASRDAYPDGSDAIHAIVVRVVG